MKVFTTLSAVLFLASFLAPTTAAAQPRAIAPEMVVDVGRVMRGEAIEHRFEIRNEGSKTLTIRGVEPACGCTVAKFDRTIAPGASGTVDAVVDTEDFKGPIAKAVTVYTDDPLNAKLELVIKADVRTQIESTPGYARFIVVQGEPSEGSRQWLWASESPALEVRSVESPLPFLKASFRRAGDSEATSRGGEGQWIVDLSLTRDAPVGPFADHVVVRTDHPGQQSVKIPISGFVRPVVAVRPRVADFGRLELTQPFSAVLEVENLGSAEVAVLGVSTDLEGAAAVVEEIEAGKRYRVEVTLPADMAKGEFRGTLAIETTSTRAPRVEVDLRGTIL